MFTMFFFFFENCGELLASFILLNESWQHESVCTTSLQITGPRLLLLNVFFRVFFQ